MILREDVGGLERVTTDEERVARGVNRDQAVQISTLSSCMSFLGKRKKFIFNVFVDFFYANVEI